MLDRAWSRSTLPCVPWQRNTVPDSWYSPVQNMFSSAAAWPSSSAASAVANLKIEPGG